MYGTGNPGRGVTVGMHEQIVVSDVNGYLASADDEWEDHHPRLVRAIERERN